MTVFRLWGYDLFQAASNLSNRCGLLNGEKVAN